MRLQQKKLIIKKKRGIGYLLSVVIRNVFLLLTIDKSTFGLMSH